MTPRKRKKNNKELKTGTIVKKIRHFGFIRVDGQENAPSAKGDVFVSQRNMKGAMLGDRVSFKLSVGRSGDVEAIVNKVIKRAAGDFVGLVYKNKNMDYAMSIDPDSNDAVLINRRDAADLVEGDLVALRIEDYGTAKLVPYGKLCKYFGHVESMRALSQAIMYDSQIMLDFPDFVREEADSFQETISQEEMDRRKDFRQLFTVTIDGRDAKDFDDAISLEEVEGGFKLYVHIADVADFVRPGSQLDKEAIKRGNSVYVPGMVAPMLPERLSNDLCSLKPGQDRLCLSCVIKLDFKGNVTHTDLYESVIRSDHRLAYEDVDIWLAKSQDARPETSWGDLIQGLESLSKLLEEDLIEGGHLDFEMSEYAFELDGHGEPISVGAKYQGPSAGIIEQCMIIANRCVAEKYFRIGLPLIYRVHERPTIEKRGKLDTFLEKRGIGATGKSYKDIIRAIKGHPLESTLMMMVLRSMEKARYDRKALGHFGLSIKDYCHFTAPIRRYSDLYVHRTIKSYLVNNGKPSRTKSLEVDKKALDDICNACNSNEIKALNVERRVESCMIAKIYQSRIGDKFRSRISSIARNAFFISLDNGVEGRVGNYLEDRDDFIVMDDDIIHDYETGRKYSFGDEIKVELIDTDVLLGWLDFIISD